MDNFKVQVLTRDNGQHFSVEFCAMNSTSARITAEAHCARKELFHILDIIQLVCTCSEQYMQDLFLNVIHCIQMNYGQCINHLISINCESFGKGFINPKEEIYW